MVSLGSVFSPSNLDALLEHLPDGSLSAVLVGAVRPATTQADARAAVQSISQKKVQEERAKLNAEDPVP